MCAKTGNVSHKRGIAAEGEIIDIVFALVDDDHPGDTFTSRICASGTCAYVRVTKKNFALLSATSRSRARSGVSSHARVRGKIYFRIVVVIHIILWFSDEKKIKKNYCVMMRDLVGMFRTPENRAVEYNTGPNARAIGSCDDVGVCSQVALIAKMDGTRVCLRG